MAYGDDWERDTLHRLHHWAEMRWAREVHEASLAPDERLDEVGWDIYYCASLTMDERDAAGLALDGTYRQRLRVRDDLFRRHQRGLQRRYEELCPSGPGFGVFDTSAPEQIEFWTDRLVSPTFIYFLQSGSDGPVKIGLSSRPGRRAPELQTGNPRELLLRHVVPGDRSVEKQLHNRFEPARIRGEWFGREYLPIIIAFSGGLADRMVHAYDGSGAPPFLVGGDVRTAGELGRIRADIERLWLAGHDLRAIAELTWIAEDDVERELNEMRAVGGYDVDRLGGFDFRAGRLVPYRSRWPRRKKHSTVAADDEKVR